MYNITTGCDHSFSYVTNSLFQLYTREYAPLLSQKEWDLLYGGTMW